MDSENIYLVGFQICLCIGEHYKKRFVGTA